MTTWSFLECLSKKTCGKRVRPEWFAGSSYTGPLNPTGHPSHVIQGVCPTFVRFHYHLDGECMKWWGLQGPKTCIACGGPVRSISISGRVSEAECNDRCLTAHGLDCECSCGGENHGKYANGKD